MSLLQYNMLGYILVINVVAYLIMCADKLLSKQKGSRVPERMLFLLAMLFGATGIFMGMKYPIYHKANKPKFKWVIPFLIVANIVAAYCYIKWIL